MIIKAAFNRTLTWAALKAALRFSRPCSDVDDIVEGDD
ncbi:hypothetical protein BSU04_05930 [Caballeronia sordidicola]|uniref:Uncharacterized protein n=1 Tax=Caballeronia sordidicola TaxID=196367 RepID=A0A226X804_CABSO|nr:hypothetical protein BSU04_05930 [Caballeronia sordidicola]